MSLPLCRYQSISNICISTNIYFKLCTNFLNLVYKLKMSARIWYDIVCSEIRGLCLLQFRLAPSQLLTDLPYKMCPYSILLCVQDCSPYQDMNGVLFFIENIVVGNSSTCSDLFWFTCIYIYICWIVYSIVQRLCMYVSLTTRWLQELMWSCVSWRSVYILQIDFGSYVGSTMLRWPRVGCHLYTTLLIVYLSYFWISIDCFDWSLVHHIILVFYQLFDAFLERKTVCCCGLVACMIFLLLITPSDLK